MFSFGLSALIAANEPAKVATTACTLPDSIPVVRRITTESTFPTMLAANTQAAPTELIVTLGANEGAPLNVTVSQSSGFSSIDAAAVSAARNAVFAPEERGCTPVGGSYFLTIQY